MINLSDYEKLNYFDTLKNTSLNKKDNETKTYMTDSAIKVIDFDEVKKKYAECFRLSQLPASNDALLQKDDKIIFIEFKDGNMHAEYYGVVRKIIESLLIFCDITKQTISDTRQYMTYILVYNGDASKKYIDKCIKEHPERVENTINESQAFMKFGRILGKMAGENPDFFGLRSRFSGIYFKNVFTIEKKDFTDDILT